MATHYSILAWKIPWKEEPNRLQSIGVQRVGYDSMTKQQQQQNHTPRVKSHHHMFRNRWRRHEWILWIGKRSEFCVQLGKKEWEEHHNQGRKLMSLLLYYMLWQGQCSNTIQQNGHYDRQMLGYYRADGKSDCPRPSKCLCSSSPFLETLKSFPESSIKWLNL